MKKHAYNIATGNGDLQSNWSIDLEWRGSVLLLFLDLGDVFPHDGGQVLTLFLQSLCSLLPLVHIAFVIVTSGAELANLGATGDDFYHACGQKIFQFLVDIWYHFSFIGKMELYTILISLFVFNEKTKV